MSRTHQVWRGRRVGVRDLAALELVKAEGPLSHRGKDRWFPWGDLDRWATWRTIKRLLERGELVWAMPGMLVALPEQASALEHIDPNSAWLAAKKVVEAINLACPGWDAERWRPLDPVPWARVYVNDWNLPPNRQTIAKLWMRWDGVVTTMAVGMSKDDERRLRAALMLIGQRSCA